MNELLKAHRVADARQRQIGYEQYIGRRLDDLALDRGVTARYVGHDPTEAAMDRPQKVAGGVRPGLESVCRRLLRANCIEVFTFFLRHLLNEQGVDSIGLVQRLAQGIDRLEIERQHERAVVQVEIDQ